MRHKSNYVTLLTVSLKSKLIRARASIISVGLFCLLMRGTCGMLFHEKANSDTLKRVISALIQSI